MKRFRRLCIFALIAALWGASLSAAPRKTGGESVVVEAEGVAPFTGNKKAARDEAKRDLFRNAAAKALGTYVESFTRTEDYEVAFDKVYSQSQGVVTDMKVISEGVAGDEYRMTASCRVASGALRGILGPALIEQIGNPRVVVRASAELDGKDVSSRELREELSQILHGAGYQILDEGQYDRLSAGGEPPAPDADVIVRADASSQCYAREKIEGTVIYGVKTRVRLRAVSPNNAMVIAEDSAQAKGTSVQLSGAAGKALSKALAEKGSSFAFDLAQNIANGRKGALKGRTLSLLIRAIPFAQTRTLKETLSENPNVTSLFQRSYSDKTLCLDVVTPLSADELAEALDAAGVEISGVLQDTVEGSWAGRR